MIDNYITGNVIKNLREKKKLTQEELAEKINVTGKAVSKWETGISGYQPCRTACKSSGYFCD